MNQYYRTLSFHYIKLLHYRHLKNNGKIIIWGYMHEEMFVYSVWPWGLKVLDWSGNSTNKKAARHSLQVFSEPPDWLWFLNSLIGWLAWPIRRLQDPFPSLMIGCTQPSYRKKTNKRSQKQKTEKKNCKKQTRSHWVSVLGIPCIFGCFGGSLISSEKPRRSVRWRTWRRIWETRPCYSPDSVSFIYAGGGEGRGGGMEGNNLLNK